MTTHLKIARIRCWNSQVKWSAKNSSGSFVVRWWCAAKGAARSGNVERLWYLHFGARGFQPCACLHLSAYLLTPDVRSSYLAT